jgi:hypothetical protein
MRTRPTADATPKLSCGPQAQRVHRPLERVVGHVTLPVETWQTSLQFEPTWRVQCRQPELAVQRKSSRASDGLGDRRLAYAAESEVCLFRLEISEQSTPLYEHSNRCCCGGGMQDLQTSAFQKNPAFCAEGGARALRGQDEQARQRLPSGRAATTVAAVWGQRDPTAVCLNSTRQTVG